MATSEETASLQALRERVAACNAKSLARGLKDGLAPIYAALGEIGQAGLDRAQIATEDGLANAGRLWGMARLQDEELKVKLEGYEHTVQVKVSEDALHLGQYLVEWTSSHYAGWLWPRKVVDASERKHYSSVVETTAWLVEKLVPHVFTTAPPNVAVGT